MDIHLRPYERLIVWREAHQLCLEIYQCTRGFPSEEKFGLVSQMRRANYSVPMNIAEGNGRRSLKERIHFLDISAGSLEEVHYQLLPGRDLGYVPAEHFHELDNRVRKTGYLLTKLRQSLA